MKYSHPNPTGYGWLIRTDSGSLIETASDEEALELANYDTDTDIDE